MRILIVTPLFPPQNAVGALRPYSWAKYWGRMGHDVTVLSVESYGLNSQLSVDLVNVKIITESVPILSKLSKKWISYENSSKITKRKGLLRYIKNCYRSFLNKTGIIMGVRYPDFRDFWVKKVINKVRNNEYDFVITTGCPYSVHRVGYYFKKRRPDTFWIIDWRDLWTQNPYWKGLYPFIWIEKHLERKFHNSANLITVVSKGLSEDLKKITQTRIEVIPNGFDSEDYVSFIDKNRNQNNKLTLVYMGTIYKGIQDITPLLIALKQLSEEGLITENDVVLKTAGNTADLTVNIERYGLSSYFENLGILPREEALIQIFNSDIAILLIGVSNRGVLTGKLFEYLSLAKCIYGIDFSSDSEAGQIIYKSKSGLCFNSDIEYIKKELLIEINQFKNKTKKNSNINYIEISKYERKKQAYSILKFTNKETYS